MNPDARLEPSNAVFVELKAGARTVNAIFDLVTQVVYLPIDTSSNPQAALHEGARHPAGVLGINGVYYFPVPWLKEKFPAKAGQYDAWADVARDSVFALSEELRSRAHAGNPINGTATPGIPQPNEPQRVTERRG